MKSGQKEKEGKNKLIEFLGKGLSVELKWKSRPTQHWLCNLLEQLKVTI